MQAPEAGGRHKTTPTPHKHSSFVYNTVHSQPGRQDGWTDGRLFLLKRVHTLEDPTPAPEFKSRNGHFFRKGRPLPTIAGLQRRQYRHPRLHDGVSLTEAAFSKDCVGAVGLTAKPPAFISSSPGPTQTTAPLQLSGGSSSATGCSSHGYSSCLCQAQGLN